MGCVSIDNLADFLVVSLVRGLSVDEDMISDRYVTSDGRFMGDVSMEVAGGSRRKRRCC